MRYVHIIRQISYCRNISVRSIVRNCLPVLFPYCSLARIEVVVRNKSRNVDLLRHDPKIYGSVVARRTSYKTALPVVDVILIKSYSEHIVADVGRGNGRSSVIVINVLQTSRRAGHRKLRSERTVRNP